MSLSGMEFQNLVDFVGNDSFLLIFINRAMRNKSEKPQKQLIFNESEARKNTMLYKTL